MTKDAGDLERFNPDCPTCRKERAKRLQCGPKCRLKKGHPPLDRHHRMSGMRPFRCRPTKRCQDNCSTGHCSHSGWQNQCAACAPQVPVKVR